MEPIKGPNGEDSAWLDCVAMFLCKPLGVKWRVKQSAWARDNCLGLIVSCDGWTKHLRIPLSQIKNQDVEAVVRSIAVESKHAIVLEEHSIQMMKSEAHWMIAPGMVH